MNLFLLRAMTRAATRAGISVLAALVTTSCAVGPDFRPPAAPAAEHYAAGADPRLAGSKGPNAPASPDAGRVAWWEGYGSPTLNAWVEEGLAHNPDLRATTATLAAARARLSAQVGSSSLPQVGAGLSGEHERGIGLPTFGPPTSLYNVYAGLVSVSYDIDLFGGIRRANEAARSDYETEALEWRAARQTLAANIVATAVRSAGLKAQMAALARSAELARLEASLTAKRYEAGAVPHRDVLDAERRAADAEAALPALAAAHSANQHALAVLLGRAPESAPADLDFESLHRPADLPVIVPSELVHQRPDILAAEAQVHAQTARVGVATANLFPKIGLSAAFGSESYSQASFLTSKTQVWNVVGGVTQPLFQGGALLAQRRASEHDLDAALARYESTVLHGFENVADSLRALEADAAVSHARSQAAASAHDFFCDTQKRAAAGAATRLAEVSSEAAWQSEHVTEVAAQSTELVDSATLFQALGEPLPDDPR